MTENVKEVMRERLGNIDQIRNLLFGDKILEDNQKFGEIQERLGNLESGLSNFKGETGERLTKLENALTSQINSAVDSLEKKLKYLSLTTHEETSKLRQDLQVIAQKNADKIHSLKETITDKTTNLEEELGQTKSTLENEIKSLNDKVFEELEQGLSSLKEGKISRVDLAEILFELCLKVKGTGFVPDLQENAENSLKTEFLLPEQQANGAS